MQHANVYFPSNSSRSGPGKQNRNPRYPRLQSFAMPLFECLFFLNPLFSCFWHPWVKRPPLYDNSYSPRSHWPPFYHNMPFGGKLWAKARVYRTIRWGASSKISEQGLVLCRTKYSPKKRTSNWIDKAAYTRQSTWTGSCPTAHSFGLILPSILLPYILVLDSSSPFFLFTHFFYYSFSFWTLISLMYLSFLMYLPVVMEKGRIVSG